MKVTSYRIADGLFLVEQGVADAPKKPAAPTNTNHVFVVDCSGSMSGQLEQVKTHMKNKLATMLRPGDTFSCIWFSGRGQFGTLIENVRLESPADMMGIGAAIDRWLKPIGLTGFKEPLEEVTRLTARIGGKNPFAMHFMSDGMDNQWPRPDVIKAVEMAGACVRSATIIEYGFYADRAFLAQMASKVGGSHVFAQDYEAFGSVFERALQNRANVAERVDIAIKGDPIGGFAYALVDGSVTAFAVENGKITVPKDTERLYYVAPAKVGTESVAFEGGKIDGAVYAAIGLFAMRGKADIVWPLLKLTGDVRLIDQFAITFGKQKYSDFHAEAVGAAFDVTKRRTGGYDPDRVPRDDAFTVLDVLRMLENDKAARLLLDSKEFKYARIGRAVEANDEALTFEADLAFGGYPLTGLVYNSSRPNVSVRVVKKGSVKLPSSRPKELPETFATQVYRTYTIVKDGLVNVSKLPALVSEATWRVLQDNGALVRGPNDGNITNATIEGVPVFEVIIDLAKLPVINRQMVKGLTKSKFFGDHFTLVHTQAQAKVYGAYLEEVATVARTSEDIAKQYGEDAATWLREQGITANGYNPKGTVAEPSGDFYVSKELKVSLKGLSSLPALDKAKEAIAKHDAEVKAKGDKAKPLAIGFALMKSAIESVEMVKRNGKDEAKLRAWLDIQQQTKRDEVRMFQAIAAQHAMTVIVGQTWFTDASSLDDNALTLKTPFGDVEAKAEQKEVEIKL